MSRRVLLLAGITLLGLVLLAACSRGQPDPAAVSLAVSATLTASAPRENQAAAPTLAATVEALLTRDASRTQDASLAAEEPLPAGTPAGGSGNLTAQAPASAATPSRWQEYASPTVAFTFLYPNTWQIVSQLMNRVTFSFPPNGVASVDVMDRTAAPAGLQAATAGADATARYAIEDQAGRYVVGTVEKGSWPGEPAGYYAVLDVNDYGLIIQWLYVVSSPDDQHIVLAKIALVDGKVTPDQRETLGKIFASVRPSSAASLAPAAQPTVADATEPAPPAPAATQPPPAATQSPPAATQPPPAATQPPPAATQPPPAAQAGAAPRVSTTNIVNLRSGPGTNYAVKAFSEAGQTYELTGRNQDGTWYQICCVAGERVWIAAAVVILTGDPASVPVVEAASAPAPEATPSPAPEGRWIGAARQRWPA